MSTTHKKTNEILDRLQELAPKLSEVSGEINVKIEQLEEELRSYPVEFSYESAKWFQRIEINPERSNGYLIGWKKHRNSWSLVAMDVDRIDELIREDPSDSLIYNFNGQRPSPTYHRRRGTNRSSWIPLLEAPRSVRLEFLEYKDKFLSDLLKSIESDLQTIETA